MDGLPLAFSLLVGFSNRAAELVKSALKAHFKDLAETTVSEIALAVSVLAGILGAFALNLNVFTLFPDSPYLSRLPDVAGIIAAGCLASVGSEGISWIFGLAKGKKEQMTTPTAKATVTLEGDGSGAQTVSASASSDGKPPANDAATSGQG